MTDNSPFFTMVEEFNIEGISFGSLHLWKFSSELRHKRRKGQGCSTQQMKQELWSLRVYMQHRACQSEHSPAKALMPTCTFFEKHKGSHVQLCSLAGMPRTGWFLCVQLLTVFNEAVTPVFQGDMEKTFRLMWRQRPRPSECLRVKTLWFAYTRRHGMFPWLFGEYMASDGHGFSGGFSVGNPPPQGDGVWSSGSEGSSLEKKQNPQWDSALENPTWGNCHQGYNP